MWLEALSPSLLAAICRDISHQFAILASSLLWFGSHDQMDDTSSLWELAKDSTRALSFTAVQLSAERTKPTKRERVLGQLGTSLFLVYRILELPSPDQERYIWARLEDLLTELERLCTVSSKPSRSTRLPAVSSSVLLSF